jgi:exopolysaccharide biosynthesis polyprenyl glycosylphosphotransferase
MLREKEAAVRQAVIILDALIVAFCFFLTYFLRRDLHLIYKGNVFPSVRIVAEQVAPLRAYFIVLILAVPIWSFSLHINGMYKSLRTKTVPEIIFIALKAAFLAVFIFGASIFFFQLKFVSRAFFIMFIALTLFFILVEKGVIFSAMHYMRVKGYNFRKLLIVGTGKRALQFKHKVESHPEWGLKIVGIIDHDRANVGKTINGMGVLASLEDLPRLIRNRAVDEVVFVVPRSQLTGIENYLYICETQGINATVAVDFFDLKISKLRQTELDGIPLITFDTTPAKERQLFLKRLIDVLVSGLGLIILSPLFLLIIIAIRSTSKGPALYIQKRVGLNGRKFVLYKFRSMYKGAHQRLSELADRNEMGGPIFKIKNDPRITPVGKILRKFSLDELPQLFNVLRGDMSLVGPRPPIPKEVRQYELWQRRRLSMRPGITCLWQVSGRNRIGFDEWMNLDLEYIDNWSLLLDMRILLRTVPAVLFGVGAS